MTNNIGIFGGTFNPVHKAHISVAEEFIEKFDLDLLYIIPNNIPPMKDNISVSGNDRTEMLKLAFWGNSKIVISDIELKRQGTSYTRDTIALMKKVHPHSKLFLLTGDDWIANFHKWKDYQFIIDNADLVVATRSGEDISKDLDFLERLTGKRPKTLGNQKIESSSTEFRENLNISLLPQRVYEYIKSKGLYGI